jgi:hypothetical protein
MGFRNRPLYATFASRKKTMLITSWYSAFLPVWFGCLAERNFHAQNPDQNSRLEAWWRRAREEVPGADRRSFDTMVILTSWMLWKQRNARVFGNQRDMRSNTADGED